MKMLLTLSVWIGFSLVVLHCSNPVEEKVYSVNRTGLKVIPLTRGIYQGAYPDIASRDDDEISQKIITTESLLKKPLAFVSYDNDFVDGITFPIRALEQIRSRKKIPLVRMLPRSTREKFSGKDPVYSLSRFLKEILIKNLQNGRRRRKNFQLPSF
jgi:hypothetical protein